MRVMAGSSTRARALTCSRGPRTTANPHAWAPIPGARFLSRTLRDDRQLHACRRGVAAGGRCLEVECHSAYGQRQLAVRQVLQPYSLVLVVPPSSGFGWRQGRQQLKANGDSGSGQQRAPDAPPVARALLTACQGRVICRGLLYLSLPLPPPSTSRVHASASPFRPCSPQPAQCASSAAPRPAYLYLLSGDMSSPHTCLVSSSSPTTHTTAPAGTTLTAGSWFCCCC